MSKPADSTPWRAILPPACRERAVAALTDIAGCLAERAGAAAYQRDDSPLNRDPLPYVGSGMAGLAVFWAFLERCQNASDAPVIATDAKEQADLHLRQAMNYVATCHLLPSFLGGAFGIAWTVEYIHRIRSRTIDDFLAEDLNGDADDVLDMVLRARRYSPSFMAGLRRETVDMSDSMPDIWEFDLFNGLAGVAVYAFERLPRESARERVRGLVGRLERESQQSARGATWYRPVQLIPDDSIHLFPRGHYSLGLGHGTAGAVAMIAQAVSHGLGGEAGERLLLRATEWLLSWRSGDAFPMFPAFLDEREQPIALTGPTPYGDSTALSWTNTDLGVAVALASAGAALGRSDWRRLAVDIAVSAGRSALAAFGANGGEARVAFMTGLAGVAHILSRMWQASGDPRCRELAQLALRRLLDARRRDLALAGFLADVGELAERHPRRYVERLGLTQGIAGIGLTLLAAMTPGIAPAWDNTLLLTPADRAAISANHAPENP